MTDHAILPPAPRLRKLPARAQSIVFPMILSLLMSGVVTTIATVQAVGPAPDLLPRILHAWMLSYAVAFPTALVMVPIVRRIVAAVVESPGR